METQISFETLAAEELDRLAALCPTKKGRPALSWNPRLRTTAGRYFRKQNLIELNPHLLTDERRVRDVLGHEYAHAVASERAPRETSHGPAWRQVMRQFGLPPIVLHDFDITALRRPSRQYKVYECPVCLVQWKVLRKYPSNSYHRCAGNKKRVYIRLVKVVDMPGSEG